MKYLASILVVILLLVSAACKKTEDSFGGEGVLAGRLMYHDVYNADSTKVPLGKRKVYLAESPSDTLNYMMSTITDDDGYFSFQHLGERSYDVFFMDSVDGRIVLAHAVVQPDEVEIALVARVDATKQTVLFVTVTDTLGGPLPNASICIFNNAALASADTCLGSIATHTADSLGRLVLYNMPAGSYYMRGAYQYGDEQYQQLAAVTVAPGSITTLQLSLSLKPQVKKTGYELTVMDTLGTPVNGSDLCVFTSKVLFAADTCLGNVYTETTDNNGKAMRLDISEGTYYIRAYASYGNVNLKGADSVVVEKNKVTKDTIYVR